MLKKLASYTGLLTIFLILTGFGGCEPQELPGTGIYACFAEISGPGGNRVKSGTPCVLQASPDAWTAGTMYPKSFDRFDITPMQGFANSNTTLVGTWLVIGGVFSYNTADITREICHIRQKPNESNVYQSDCKGLALFGDITYDPSTMTLSNDGKGTIPIWDNQYGEDVVLQQVPVVNSAKIDGLYELRRFQLDENGDRVLYDFDGDGVYQDYSGSSTQPLQLVRIGGLNLNLGGIQLRDVSALEADSAAPYTRTIPITGFAEQIRLTKYVDATSWSLRDHQLGNLNEKSVLSVEYHFYTTDNNGNHIQVAMAQNTHGDWRKVGAQYNNKASYICDNNGSNNGCADTQTYPGIDQFPTLETAKQRVQVVNRKMVISDGNTAVDAQDLVEQADNYFDLLENTEQRLKIHFQYHTQNNHQDGLIDLDF